MLTKSTSAEAWKMSLVPLPWCTSESMISTRSAPQRSIARCAATATLLNRQKPIARADSAWCPGGRCSDAPTFGPSPSSASTIATAPPAECSAASQECSETIVSTSSAPPPAAQTPAMVST
jgi:hypothetical protein